MDQTGLPVSLQAFDGSQVYEDLVLNRWLKTEEASSIRGTPPSITPCRCMTAITSRGQSKTADYKVRAQKLFDDR